VINFKKLVDGIRSTPAKPPQAAAEGPQPTGRMAHDALRTSGPAPRPELTNALQGLNGRLKDLAASGRELEQALGRAPDALTTERLKLRLADLGRAQGQLAGLRDGIAALAVRQPPLGAKGAAAVAKLAVEAGQERDPARLAAIATSIRKHASDRPVDAQLFNATRAVDWAMGALARQATALTAQATDAPDAASLQRAQLQLDDVLKQHALLGEVQALVSGLAFGAAPRRERKDAIFQLAHQAAEAGDLASLQAITGRLRELAPDPR
jgi:hypothetical protein